MNMASNSSLDSYLLLRFRSRLRQQQRELGLVIEKTGKDMRGLVDAGPADPADLSCRDLFQEAIFANLSQIRRQLRLVEYALEQIRIGKFGICASCDDVIALKRLQVVPWARHCLECQKRLEHVQRHAAIVELYCGNTLQGYHFCGPN